MWEYPDAMSGELISDLFPENSIYGEKCLFCSSDLISRDIPNPCPLDPETYRRNHQSNISGLGEEMGDLGKDVSVISGFPEKIYCTLCSCPVCGWWKLINDSIHCAKRQLWYMSFASAGMLRKLDLTDIRLPLSDVRQYLVARYSDRFDIHPRKFEETVASVFRDLGYYSFVTGYTRDGGIDVVLERSSGEQVGVQVKRYRDRIEVEQIRSFIGALIDKELTHGIFVSTSSFRKGAKLLSNRMALKGMYIELMDAHRFFQALKLSQLKHPFSVSLSIERKMPHMECISEYAMNSL
jgi:restriction system protein